MSDETCPVCGDPEWNDCPCPAEEQRDAAVRARAEVEAKLEGVRAAAEVAIRRLEPGYSDTTDAEAAAGLQSALDAHRSDALRALVERAVRAAFDECGEGGSVGLDFYAVVARVLGGGFERAPEEVRGEG